MRAVYSIFYGSPSPIYFNCADGELSIEIISAAAATDGEGGADDGEDDERDIVDGDSFATVMRNEVIRSAQGGQQGCVLATNGCCLPYHLSLSLPHATPVSGG